MSRRLVLLWWLCVSAILVCAAGCRRSGTPLARLDAMVGQVDRDWAKKMGSFSAARIGEQFGVGDAVRTGVGARADLKLVEGSSLTLEQSTLMRFVTRSPGDRGQRIQLELGQVVLTAGPASLTIATSFGEAVVQPNTSLRLTRTATGARFEVTFGSAIVNQGGKTQEVTAGQKVEIGAASPGPGPSASSSAPPPASASPPGTLSLEVIGNSARIRPPEQREFSPLPAGTSQVAEGSKLELGSDTSAVLHTAEGGMRLVGAGTFSLGGPGDARVRAESGTVDLTPRSSTLTVAVPGGTIRVLAGSRASLRTEQAGTKLSVAQGSAAVEAGKTNETVRGGEEIMIKAGGTLQRLRSRGLDYADLLAPAGDSFAVHDPRPPTVVGIQVGSRCETSAVVQLTGAGKTEVVGEKTINVPLRAGGHPYVVRCLGADGRPAEEVAHGTIAVTADAGTRRLPTKPAASVVDADGRNYTVLFQNLLPSVTVRWPRAPAADSFVLSDKPPKGPAQTVTTKQPQYTFAAGKLAEGTHEFTFEGGGVRTKPTVVEIRFDNATPAASITSPADGSFGPGSRVTVAGTALPGSTVSVLGTELPQDDQHRFSGDVQAPSAERALAIRFVNPQRGAHIYLRRPSGANR